MLLYLQMQSAEPSVVRIGPSQRQPGVEDIMTLSSTTDKENGLSGSLGQEAWNQGPNGESRIFRSENRTSVVVSVGFHFNGIVVRVSDLQAVSVDDNAATTFMLWHTVPRGAKVKDLR